MLLAGPWLNLVAASLAARVRDATGAFTGCVGSTLGTAGPIETRGTAGLLAGAAGAVVGACTLGTDCSFRTLGTDCTPVIGTVPL